MNQVKKLESGKDAVLAWCVLPECGVKNFRQILRALKRSVLGKRKEQGLEITLLL